MGCTSSKVEDPNDHINAQIEQQLREEKLQPQDIKILLLGAGESGKSTIVKQMKLLHGGGFSSEEFERYREVIFSNVYSSMESILYGLNQLNLSFDNPKNEDNARLIKKASYFDSDAMSEDKVNAFKALWADSGVQEAMKLSNQFQVIDSAPYYFENIDRIAQANYVPTEQDILRSRIKTTGITETTFKIDDVNFRMMDVGGQRSERKKWIHCFEGVTAVLYLIAISEYDQTLIEDETVNRVHEALSLFDSVCNSKWFQKTSVILFLNKTDIFREKIRSSPISNYFPDYSGGDDFDQGANYFRQRFESLNKHSSKHVYTHLTCATDTNNIRFVMAAVKDILMQSNLRNVGLL
ncbi:guanine nucleotide binding protein, alpha subunit [Neoconidiobolus thromboides FSU 785]|nr:guanine nucleotide binding protein, alpha subunit [Neoconidiobolus thromboides FSU 785]